MTNELLSLQYGGIDRRIAFPATPLHEVHRPAAKSMAVGLSRLDREPFSGVMPPGDHQSGSISHRPAALYKRFLTQNAET